MSGDRILLEMTETTIVIPAFLTSTSHSQHTQINSQHIGHSLFTRKTAFQNLCTQTKLQLIKTRSEFHLFQKLKCERKEPCRLFSVKKSAHRADVDEVTTSSLCSCPHNHRCPQHHLDVGVVPGRVYSEDAVRAYSGYCMWPRPLYVKANNWCCDPELLSSTKTEIQDCSSTFTIGSCSQLKNWTFAQCKSACGPRCSYLLL